MYISGLCKPSLNVWHFCIWILGFRVHTHYPPQTVHAPCTPHKLYCYFVNKVRGGGRGCGRKGRGRREGFRDRLLGSLFPRGLNGCLRGCLFGCCVCCSIGCSIGCCIGCSMDCSIVRFIDHWVHHRNHH